ncbi:MAG: ABC transporter permease [Dehalococcoidales bacterium]|nr:ABC transporter permease [Dehalococcoidales bacterium]
MTETNIAANGVNTMPPRVTEWQRFRKAFFSRKIVILGMVLIGIFLIFALFCGSPDGQTPWLAPYAPYKINMSNVLASPSWEHWLGTDTSGRDILSRIMYGARTALTIGLIATGISAIIGCALGMISAFFGRWVSMIIMRIVDTFMCIPSILLAMMIASVLGHGMQNLIIALTIGSIPMYVRMMNGVALSVRQNDYVLAGKAMGASNWRMIITHIFPNSVSPIIIQTTLQLGFLILAEAGLSYLGIGIRPPTAAWGSMVVEGVVRLRDFPILTLAPGIAVMLTVFGFNLVGDGLRDALDPRLRGRL